MDSVAFLILMTSRKTSWKSFHDSHFINIFMPTFLKCCAIENFDTHIFIGIDENDPIFDTEDFTNFLQTYKDFLTFHVIKFTSDIKPGHVTVMWNKLFEVAYAHEKQIHYFYQCGDDVAFLSTGWLEMCIEILKVFNGFGAVGPQVDNMEKSRILTQIMVGRKHMEIFGYFFPPEITNWFCDDWINKVYNAKYALYTIPKFIKNMGGKERYDIDFSYQENQNEFKLIAQGLEKLSFKIGLIVQSKSLQIRASDLYKNVEIICVENFEILKDVFDHCVFNLNCDVVMNITADFPVSDDFIDKFLNLYVASTRQPTIIKLMETGPDEFYHNILFPKQAYISVIRDKL